MAKPEFETKISEEEEEQEQNNPEERHILVNTASMTASSAE